MSTPSRQQQYINDARLQTRNLWNAYQALLSMQAEWNAQDYGTTLQPGEAQNSGIDRDDVGAVVFATAEAMEALFATGHATNITNLL